MDECKPLPVLRVGGRAVCAVLECGGRGGGVLPVLGGVLSVLGGLLGRVLRGVLSGGVLVLSGSVLSGVLSGGGGVCVRGSVGGGVSRGGVRR